VTFFLAHPWRWHRKPRSWQVNLARAAAEAAVLGVVLAVLAAWPWPGWLAAHLPLRVFLACCYGAMAAAAVVTMRLERRAGP
jgi:hypothetical protein